MKFRYILVSLLIFGVLAWVLVSSDYRFPPTRAGESTCGVNLSNLHVFGAIYAKRGDGYFPQSPSGSIAALQQLVEAFPDFFLCRPDVFTCPDGQATPASVVAGRLTLTTESCSYEAAPWRLKPSEKDAILYYDKKPYHRRRRERRRGRMAILTDGTVLFMDEETFEKRIEDERARFSVREKQTTEERSGS